MRVTSHGPGANSSIAIVRARDVCYIDGTDTTHDVCYIDGTDTTRDVCYIDGTDTTRDVCDIDGTDTTRDVCYIDGTDTTHDVCYVDGTDTTHDVCYIDGTDTTHDVCYIDSTDTTHDVCYIDVTDTTHDVCYVDGTDTTRDVCYIDGTDTTHDVCYVDSTDTTHDVCYIDVTDTTQIPRRFDGQRPAHVQLGTFCANTLRVLLLGNDSCSSVETWTSPVALGIRNIPVKNMLANNAGQTRQSITTLPGPYIVPAAQRLQTTAYERHIVTTLHRYIDAQNIRDVRVIAATRAVLSMATTASGPGHGVRLTSSQSRSSHLTAQSAMMRRYAAVHNKRMYNERVRQLLQTVARTVMIDILLPYRMYDAAYVVTRLSELQPTDDNRTYRFPTSTSSCRLWNLYIDAIQHGVYAAIPTSDVTTGTTDWMTNTNSCGPIG